MSENAEPRGAVNAPAGQGVQVGDHNTQINVFGGTDMVTRAGLLDEAVRKVIAAKGGDACTGLVLLRPRRYREDRAGAADRGRCPDLG